MTKRSAAHVAKTIEDLLKVIEMLMPGVRHLALQDYQILNEAPMRATRLVKQLREDPGQI